MSTLLNRTVFGSLYVGLVLWAILSLQTTPIVFLIVFSVFVFIGICEYTVLAEVNRTRPLRTILDGMAAVYLFVTYLLPYFVTSYDTPRGAFVPYYLYLAYIFVRAIYSDRELMPDQLAKIIFGQLYVVVPLCCAGLLGAVGQAFHISPLLIACVCIWSNDTGAFLAGSGLGKRPLFPSVSPKKSWEGFWGGMFASVAAAIILGSYLSETSIPLWQLTLIGIVVSVASTWGDLFESMLKRQAGVKDSGSIIPGHGGILDRIDSMLFVFPALYILHWLIF